MARERLAIMGWIVGIGFGLYLFFAVVYPAMQKVRGTDTPDIAKTPSVIKQVQSLNQLVTVKYVMEKVIILEDVKWFGENRLLMVAHGIVKAGVDLSDLKEEDITVSGNKVTIK